MNNNEMHFLISSDSNYINKVIVLMESIGFNHPNNKLIFHIITTGLNSKATSRVEDYATTRGFLLDIITVSKEDEKYNDFRVTARHKTETYFYFFCHEYLPKELDRVLWLHADCIVEKNIYEFYSLDFQGMFIIAGGTPNKSGELSPIYGIEQQRVDNMLRRDIWGLFDSGVILFNLERMRKEVTIDFYKPFLTEDVLDKYDARLLTLAFTPDAVDVNPYIVDWRPHACIRDVEKFMSEGFVFSPSIIHYDEGSLLCKPWELYLEENEVDNIPIISNKVPALLFNKELNHWYGKWWNYAKMTPVYDEEYAKMQPFKAYFLSRGLIRVRRLSKLAIKVPKLQNELNLLKINSEKIVELQKSGFTFLQSVQKYYQLDNTNYIVQNNNVNLNDYFKEFYPQLKNHCIFIISSKADCQKQWHQLQFLDMLGLKENQSDKPRFSYIAVVDPSRDFVYESSAPAPEIIRFDYVVNNFEVNINNTDNVTQIRIPNKQAFISIASMGHDIATKASLSEVFINNINYSINKQGLNVVVFDKQKMSVIDSLTCDVYGDKKLIINRT